MPIICKLSHTQEWCVDHYILYYIQLSDTQKLNINEIIRLFPTVTFSLVKYKGENDIFTSEGRLSHF